MYMISQFHVGVSGHFIADVSWKDINLVEPSLRNEEPMVGGVSKVETLINESLFWTFPPPSHKMQSDCSILENSSRSLLLIDELSLILIERQTSPEILKNYLKYSNGWEDCRMLRPHDRILACSE